MPIQSFRGLRASLLGLVLLVIAAAVWALPVDQANRYVQQNLVSDQAGKAANVDPNLVNAWGLYFSPTGPFWVNNNGTGTATVYNALGQAFPAANPLVVTIPRPAGASGPGNSKPTGGVFNGTTGFQIQ